MSVDDSAMSHSQVVHRTPDERMADHEVLATKTD